MPWCFHRPPYLRPCFFCSLFPSLCSFRTRKYSSFQRNLNLYGFTKVRRGPDSDMYAHPSFVRQKPESLLNLRKISNSSRRKATPPQEITCHLDLRPVSPSVSDSTSNSVPSSPAVSVDHQFVITKIPSWGSAVQVLSRVPTVTSPKSSDDRGKLDLLTLALEQASAMNQ